MYEKNTDMLLLNVREPYRADSAGHQEGHMRQQTSDWQNSTEAGAFLRDLFGSHWRPEMLVKLAGLESAAGRRCFSPAEEGSAGVQSLDALLQSHESAAALLRHVDGSTPFERFLRCLAEEDELGALEVFLEMGEQRIRVLSTDDMRAMLTFALERLQNFSSISLPQIKRFLALCRELNLFIVCSGIFISGLPEFFFRAREMALGIGDSGEIALMDLLIGSLNVCNIPEHNSPYFHEIMARGRAELDMVKDPAVVETALPYLGIFAFQEGDYEQAMNLFSRASRKMRIQRRRYFEMFYARHWGFAAANRGDFDLAVRLLLTRLRQADVSGDSSLSRNMRSQLAFVYLRMGKSEKALEQLDIALTGITKKTDIASAVTTLRHLACYHMFSGHIEAAYKVLLPALRKAEAQGYQRPVYLNGVFLELLASLQASGLPPLPCYSFEDELARCLSGPNRLLRGVAFRVQGRLLERAGKAAEAEEAYRRSIALLDAIHNTLGADQTRLFLASLLLDRDEKEAALLVNEAWRSYRYQKPLFWPDRLLRLVPSYLNAGEENVVSAHALVEAFRDSFAPRRSGLSFEEFSRILLTESGRLLGASEGWLYHRSQPSAPLRLVEKTGTDQELFPGPASAEEMAELVAEGEPVILDSVTDGEKSVPGMFVGLPLDCRPYGLYVLCLAGTFPEKLRAVLDETLLRDIGRVLTWPCMLTLETESRTQSAAAPAEGAREMIWVSRKMQDFLADVDNAAGTDAAVLLNGESGVGKEMLARRIHERSGRSGRLVTINMASLQDELFESEFFGHEKGAFTGAMNSKLGLVELADNGTLFLDELTEASPRVQAKLLRVLQERSFMRVGGTRSIRINFRLVAATNRNLGEAVRRGTFRADLYYRVAVICLHIPPLRERRQDILPLARYYLHHFAHRHGRDVVQDFSEANCRLFEQWPWPGNIRELRNVVEQSVILSGGRTLSFHEGFCEAPVKSPVADGPSSLPAANEPEMSICSVEEAERRCILAALRQTGWRIDGPYGALAILKISRSALYAKIRKYGLAREREVQETSFDAR